MLSCAVGREEDCKEYHWCVWGVLSVYGPRWVCPHSQHVCFPVYTAQAPGCSAGELSKTGPGLCALSRSKPLRFRFSGIPQRHKLGWAFVWCPTHVQAAQVSRCLVSTFSQLGGRSSHLPGPTTQFPGCAVGTLSQVCCVSPLGS